MSISLLLLIPALFVAAYLHEITHVIAVYPIAVDIDISDYYPHQLLTGSMSVEYVYDADKPYHEQYATFADISPSVIGLSTILVILLSPLSFPALDVATLPLYAGAIVYSVGGPADYQI